jgi:hypothetical protein
MNKSLRRQLVITASLAPRKGQGEKEEPKLDAQASAPDQSPPSVRKSISRPPIRHAGINE